MCHTQYVAVIFIDLNDRYTTIPTGWQRTGNLPDLSAKNRMKRTFLSNLPGARDRHQYRLSDCDSCAFVWNIYARGLVARVCNRSRYNHLERYH